MKGLQITQEQIEEAKKVHKKLRLATLQWDDEERVSHSVEVLFRVPTVADAEVYGKTASLEPVVASRNLFASLVVSPKSEEILEIVGDKSAVLGAFVENEVAPFFGKNVKTTSRVV